MRKTVVTLMLLMLVGLVWVTTASATPTPFWQLQIVPAPATMHQGDETGDDMITVTSINLGGANAEGSANPITISDTLPAGLRVLSVSGIVRQWPPAAMKCTSVPIQCTYEGSVFSYAQVVMLIKVAVETNAVAGADTASVAGGGAAAVSTSRQIGIGTQEPEFGIDQTNLTAYNEDGSVDTQAGSHPFELTSAITFNEKVAPGGHGPESVGIVKDLHFKLPPGLVGNPTPVPQCSDEAFNFHHSLSGPGNRCPTDTVIGVADVTLSGRRGFNTIVEVPLFNLVPSPGEPARFGFKVVITPIILDTEVSPGGGYRVHVNVNNISQYLDFESSTVTFWGVPNADSHNASRGWECLAGGTVEEPEGCQPPSASRIIEPFLSMPTVCDGTMGVNVSGDSWSDPGNPVPSESSMTGMDGCNHLDFRPSISVAPDGHAGSTGTGLTVGVHVPQISGLNPDGLSPATVRDTTVALPDGVAVNPAGSDGLLSCSMGQIGLGSEGPGSCPDASKIGTVEISTPLLPHPLEGAVYLAAQEANPFGSLLALYLVAEDPVSGVVIKQAGEVKLDPVTGQLVTTFNETPPLPFEGLKLHFFGGDRAPLSSPALCGTYTTSAAITPWSNTEPALSSSSFQVNSGANRMPCSDPLPFGPSLTAGSTSIQAGSFTPFTMTMSREDGNQNLDSIKLNMPPGLLGELSKVKLCGEAEGNAGTCGPQSLIGETTVSVGLGSNPFTVTGGKVYITGPYAGSPYGLSIVNPAKAGPFDLENTTGHHPACDCLVVRAKIEVDPTTAAIVITSDTTGPYRIPEMLEGIPLQIKHVNVTINRPEFTFNPTNCEKMQIGGNLTSSQGAVSTLHVPFQVTNCATLAFKPIFSVSTNGKTSRANGASLHVKLTYPNAPFGTQANIGKVKVDLPKQLPSRLTTLQKACPDSTFNANPAACPADSRVGTATATTPVLPVYLQGPAYFVSHGGQKFPELIVALSGQGVTVYLHGETFISKQGITSSTFRTIPDVPVGTFELTLPQGPDSALAANGNLCTAKLTMPTAFVAANGMSIHQNTPITATGCTRHKARHHKHKSRKGKKK